MINQEQLKTIDGLLKSRIPLKRTAAQRDKKLTQQNESGDSSSEKGKDGPDSDYDSEVEKDHFPQAEKRFNDG